MIMRLVLKAAAASVLLAMGATLALAQATTRPPDQQVAPGRNPTGESVEKKKSNSNDPEMGNPPAKQAPSPSMGTGSRPIGPPSTQQVAPGKNPAGESVEKKKSNSNDPEMGNPPVKK